MATVIGTVVAYLIVPMRSLGPDGWKIAAALMGSYIGGGNLPEAALSKLQASFASSNFTGLSTSIIVKSGFSNV